MGIGVDKIIQGITSSPKFIQAGKTINAAAANLGAKYEKTGFSKFFNNTIDPRGGNNSFMGLATLMAFGVIMPRVITALKRNPDNKEATIDEIKEILFRDVQSVLIVLFMLKTANSLIDSFVSKKSGLPLLSKPYKKLFDDSIKGIGAKIQDFIQHPKEKLGIIIDNIKAALHPTGGSIAKTNNEYIADYSNYSWDNLKTFFPWIKERGGSEEKVFDKIINGTISKYKYILEGGKIEKSYGVIGDTKIGTGIDGVMPKDPAEQIKNAQSTIKKLEELKGKGPDILNSDEIQNDKAIKTAIIDFLSDKDNSLVKAGKGTNSWLRLGALAMEASYLGFGIPALNQLRLEKKYLREHKNDPKKPEEQSSQANNSLINKNIKAHQVKLYHDFIK